MVLTVFRSRLREGGGSAFSLRGLKDVGAGLVAVFDDLAAAAPERSSVDWRALAPVRGAWRLA